ncbi:MAG: thiamine diphosphokinase [Desulfobacterales bacterium]|nr:thiamine diphosphokinase [Desulfobacterales bacterium]
MRSILFANGSISNPEIITATIRTDDFVIAADGGARHCLTMDITPDVIIGDFDSLTEKELNRLNIPEENLIRYPAAKDKTDLQLAIELAVDRGANEIILFGALGGRWDMSLANILLMASLEKKNTAISIIDGKEEIRILKGRNQITLSGKTGNILSLIPIGGDATGVTLSGLIYSLEDGTLKFGDSRGISNKFAEDKVTIQLKQGLLICIHTHK